MEKGQIVEIYIHDMSHEGKGIGYCDGMTVFADGAVAADFKMMALFGIADCSRSHKHSS